MEAWENLLRRQILSPMETETPTLILSQTVTETLTQILCQWATAIRCQGKARLNQERMTNWRIAANLWENLTRHRSLMPMWEVVEVEVWEEPARKSGWR